MAPTLLVLAAVVGSVDAVAAQEQRFRFGIALPLERTSVTFAKAVDNTDPNTLVPDPRRGQVFEDQDSAAGSLPGMAVLAGYEWPLGGAGFLGAELDVAWRRGSVDGKLAGVGLSPERKQLGESWPDDWSFEEKRSYGLTLRLGGSPGALAGRGERAFVLAGARRRDTRITVDFNGCFSPTPCTPDEFGSGTDVRDQSLVSWVLGAGFEKEFGEHVAVRVEGTYATHAEESWAVGFPDVGVTVPTSVGGGGPGVTVALLLSR